jgi:hypothetical protein
LVRELSTNDKVEHEADLKGFAIEAHNRFVCAALPLNEKDQRLTKGVPNIIRNAAVGSGHQLHHGWGGSSLAINFHLTGSSEVSLVTSITSASAASPSIRTFNRWPLANDGNAALVWSVLPLVRSSAISYS